MSLGNFFKEIGSGLKTGINDTSNFLSKDPIQGFLKKDVVKPVEGYATSGLERLSQGLNWLYSNGVSQPISTALMAGELKGGPFSAHNWAVSWHAANHISPGQALFLNSDQTTKAVNSKLEYYKPGAAYLPPGFDQLSEDEQQDFLKKAGMPVVGNRYINELRQADKTYKNATGLADFALHWWGEPAVLAGKAFSKERELRTVLTRPTPKLGLVRNPEGKLPLTIGRKGNAGWSGQDIDKIMANSAMAKVEQTIWENHDNPALLDNLPFAKQSALGPRLGAIASHLKSPGEVHDFVRVGLGDVGAIEKLQTSNALAASRIEQDTSRFAALDAMHTRYANLGDSRMTGLIEAQMKELNARVNTDELLIRRYNQVLDHAHELDRVNLSRWQFAKAQARTTDDASYRAGVARGVKAQKLVSDENGMRRVSITPRPPIFKAGTSTPVDLGLVKNRIYGLGDFFSTPVTMVRSLGNARPNGYMRLDDLDRDSIAELRGQIARIPGISSQTRLNMLNEYQKTQTEGERLELLKTIGAMGAAKVAEKHGLDPEAGREIYQEHLKRQFGEIDNMKRYSAATRPIQLPDGSFARIKVDEFATDGGKVVVHPNLATRLANDHVFQDLDEMDKVLGRHSSAIKALRTHPLGNTDWMVTLADGLNSLWKFGTLFRLGYIPRVASDDLAGQVARLGSATMALRAGWGIRNAATNIALYHRPAFYAAQHATAMEGVRYADEEMASLRPQISTLNRRIKNETQVRSTDVGRARARVERAQARVAALTEDMPKARHTAAKNYLIAKQNELERAQARNDSLAFPRRQRRLARLQDQMEHLQKGRDEAQAQADEAAKGFQPVRQGSQRVELPGGVEAPAAFEGQNGQYAYKQVSSDEAVGQLLLSNKSLIHGHLMRSFDNGAKAISANTESEELHATSWAHAINAQLMQDPLAKLAVRGASPEQMTKWLTSTAEGRLYQRRLGMNPGISPESAQSIIRDPADLANAAWHDVAEYMPTPEIRMKAMEPEGVTPTFLKKAVPMVGRPDIHTGQVGQAARSYYGVMDKIMAKWYKFAATLPADRLSRHPLFNQLYEGHLHALTGQLMKQGAYDRSAGAIEEMAQTARRLALKDTRKLVFDIAHRSDAAAALRFISPFFAATTESFQRWARIIADRPQVVGYASNFYNAPAANGHMQDADGNEIDADGYTYTIDPKTGKAVKKLVPKSQRYIVGRMPKWAVGNTVGKYTLGAAFGIEPASRDFVLSQNSMDLVTQGDPWFNPGMGPIVQIPVNHFVKDKPRAAELARHLQILPFGPQGGGGPLNAGQFLIPSTIKNFLTAYDTSDQRYQQIKMQIMQKAIFEHENMGKPMPSPSQIAGMTKNYWKFAALSSFLQPMATHKADPYQFYRDQYNALQRENPLTADDEFLKRFGSDYFVFAQSMSKNNSGAPATVKAIELEKKYGDLIGKNPELAALIIGPEGNGPFSPEAYSYQLNTPLTPGGSEMQRSKMSADEALADNQRRKGWSDFTTLMNALGAQLRTAGFQSYSDKGAEQFAATKRAIVTALGSPTLPNGQPNPYYNEAWSKDYNTLDPLKYERLVPGLQVVADSELARDPQRSDLRVLQNYLVVRQYVTQELAARKRAGGSNVITAKSNADLLAGWQHIVDSFVESNTNFGDLHSRYLSRDLGYSETTDNEELAA